MYVIKNAWKSITRNKGRSLMIMIIALIIALASCVALSIREAAQTAQKETIEDLSVTAQLSFDRTTLMSNMKQPDESTSSDESGEQQPFDRSKFDFDALMGTQLTLDDYMEYTSLMTGDDSYYYTLTVSLNTYGDLLPYGTTEEDAEEESASTQDTQAMPGGMNKGGAMMSGGRQQDTGDFTISGYSSYDAMLSLFGNDGTNTISDGEMFDIDSSDNKCVISDELALYNDLEAGDTITLVNPNCDTEIYTLTISGVYTNTDSDDGNSMFSRSDPANNIYMSAKALQNIIDTSTATGNTTTNSDGEETSAVLKGETIFTYVFNSIDNYEKFEAAAEKKGLPENYILSSSDLAAYENSLAPLESLSSMTGWFFLVVLAVGGIILIVFNVFTLRERKYEVGVLTAIGMKKRKVAGQFICELFIITFFAIIIGAGAGAAASVPVTNALLKQQIEKTEANNDEVSENFGFEKGQGNRVMNGGPGGMGNTESQDVSYIDSVSSATNLTVILEMAAVGILLTVMSSLAAMITIMRYEPLRILSSRS